MQATPMQHGVVALQVWPVPAQTAAWQVPFMHDVPLQQSDVAVQAPPCGWHVRAAPHAPRKQIIEQHWADAVQLAPCARHAPASPGPPSPPPSTRGLPQTPPLHVAGAQQSPEVVHIAPAGLQVGSMHCTPSAPGTQQDLTLPCSATPMLCAPMRTITDVAKDLGLSGLDILPYGHHLAKVSFPTYERLRSAPPRGKLVLVSAMTPTKYGEGKTTTTIGLTQGLVRRGHKAVAALREPSLGPVFGAKGGGTGGGQSTMEPSARINLHCTGDLHAIGAANNLLAALCDNALNFGTAPLKQVTWRRCIDMNDRFLRNTVIGLGGPAHGVPREEGFDITAASQVMATLCMAGSVEDLKARLSRLIVGVDSAGKPITAGDLKAVGAMAALLHDALLPNIAQTTEGSAVLVHGGPFANIAHGCNSVVATRSALGLADIVCTEAGFAFDLGGEKFLDLKCRMHGLWPAAVVLVVTARAMRFHGGDTPGLTSIEKGFENVARHLQSIRSYGLTPIVAINTFPT